MIRREEVYKIGRLGKTHGVRGEISFLLDDDVFDRTDADYLILDIDGILVPFFIEEQIWYCQPLLSNLYPNKYCKLMQQIQNLHNTMLY